MRQFVFIVAISKLREGEVAQLINEEYWNLLLRMHMIRVGNCHELVLSDTVYVIKLNCGAVVIE